MILGRFGGWVWAGSWVLISGAQAAESVRAIAVLGLNAQRQPVMEVVSTESLQASWSRAVAAVDRAVISTLERMPRCSSTSEKGSAWSLSSVTVGVAPELGAKFGKWIKVGIHPRFRLVYSQERNPVIPD